MTTNPQRKCPDCVNGDIPDFDWPSATRPCRNCGGTGQLPPEGEKHFTGDDCDETYYAKPAQPTGATEHKCTTACTHNNPDWPATAVQAPEDIEDTVSKLLYKKILDPEPAQPSSTGELEDIIQLADPHHPITHWRHRGALGRLQALIRQREDRARAEGRQEAVAVIEQEASYYPTSVFREPDGKGDFPPDCYTAAGCRLLARNAIAAIAALNPTSNKSEDGR